MIFRIYQRLYILNLEHNPVKEYTGTIGFQDKLRELYLTSNHSKELPLEIVNLTNLEILKLGNSFYLSSLPVGFGKLSNLKLLDLSFCEELKSIPSEIGLLRNLTSLNLRKISNKGTSSRNR